MMWVFLFKFYVLCDWKSMKRFNICLEDFDEDGFGNHTALSFANEGLVDRFVSFVQKSISSEESLRKAIQNLKDKKVRQITTIEYEEKYSGLKILNTDKVTSEYILKYLKKVNQEIEYVSDLAKDLFEFLLKVIDEKNTMSEEQTKRNLVNIQKDIDDTEDDIRVLKTITRQGEDREKFSISTCDQKEFDEIVKGIELIIKKNTEYNRILNEYKDDIIKWFMYDMVPHDNNRARIVSLGHTAIRTVIEYLENFRIHEKKFLFSLTKYLQASVE